MTGKTLDISTILTKDTMAVEIANKWIEWYHAASGARTRWKELRDMLFATDTSTTTVGMNTPWKNKTVIPKLMQIRDNLFANYKGAVFPKRKWLKWEPDNQADLEKADKIENYTYWLTQNPTAKIQADKMLDDFIDYGNVFAMPEWLDERVIKKDQSTQVGFVGPAPRRISPHDIAFNALAPSFQDSPKIIRSIVTLGELKDLVENKQSLSEEEKEYAEAAFAYARDLRRQVNEFAGGLIDKNESLAIDGFGNVTEYLSSNYVEVLNFYGDFYDVERDKLYKNYIITVVDRHKVLYKEPSPTFFGKPPIFHVGWRDRPDNLWAMGPLENLVGMQYRLNHIENLKADVFDLITFPMLKIKGVVDEFEWQPFGRIYVGEEGDVEIMAPDVQALNANLELDALERKMEEMAGAPKEALGFRTPGEKTAFEVQRLENAASRIFQIKAIKFEGFLENVYNAMLEMSVRIGVTLTISFKDPKFGSQLFQEITTTDLAGTGRIRPVGAKHFAERAELVQNIMNFQNSGLGQDERVMRHFSGLKRAQMIEEAMDWNDYDLVSENIGIIEDADAQSTINAGLEKTSMQAQTPAGLEEDDFDEDVLDEAPTEEDIDAEEQEGDVEGVFA